MQKNEKLGQGKQSLIDLKIYSVLIILFTLLGVSLFYLDGGINRTLTITGVTLVAVDNQLLHPDLDYTATSTIIPSLNQLWNEFNITGLNLW